MKVILKSSLGKSLVVDVSPNDTFVDLQARTFQKTGCLLNLENFKLKGREIKAENNVMKYFQGVMHDLNTKEVEEIYEQESEEVVKSLPSSVSGKVNPSRFSPTVTKSRQRKRMINSNRTFNSPKLLKTASDTNIENSENVSCLNLKQDEESDVTAVRNGKCTQDTESVSQHDSNRKSLLEVRNNEYQNGEGKYSADVKCLSSENTSSYNYRTSSYEKADCSEMSPNGNKSQLLRVENAIEAVQNKPSVDIMSYSEISDSVIETLEHSQENSLTINSENTRFEKKSCKKETTTNITVHKSELDLNNFRKILKLQHINDFIDLYSSGLGDESCIVNNCENSKFKSSPEANAHNVETTSVHTNVDGSKAAANSADFITRNSVEPRISSEHINMTSMKEETKTATNPPRNVDNIDVDVDSSHPGQLCRLCALPRKAMIYIYSERGVRLGLRSKINTWLPTHVSRTDPLPKQVCNLCIKKLNLCQDFGTECIKAEQILKKFFESHKFRCHIQVQGEVDVSGKKSKCRNTYETKLSSDSHKTSGNKDKDIEENTIIESEGHASNITSESSNFKTSFIKTESLSSEDDESSFVMSEDSSENELMDMILEESCDGERVTVPTEYCCPLCCEGNMVTVNTSSVDSQLSNSSESLVLDNRTSSKTQNELTVKKFPNISDISNLELFRYVNAEYLRPDCDSSYENLIDQGSESDSEVSSFIFGEVKEEDESSREKIAGISDKIDDKSVSISDQIVEVKLEKLEDNTVNCFVCGETMSNLNQCLIHSLRFHADSESQSYPCGQCEMCFRVDTDMTRHFMTVHQNMKVARLLHICIVCGRHCASQRALKSHVCIPFNAVTDRLACKTCGQSFSTKARLVFHHQFHDPNARPLECVPCGMVFTEENNLYDHIRFSHRGQAFICSECGGHFNSKAALRGHLRSHRNLRHHKCDICSKTFLDKQTLKEHAVSHMDVKPFQCHICGKYLNRNSRLKKHLMSHELQKNTNPQECFQCTACGETFPDEPKAVNHAQVGHSLPSESECVFQLYPIDKLCPEQFVNSWSLAYHRKTRHCETQPPPLDGDVPGNERKRWKCKYCEKRYVSQHSLLAHVSMMHAGDNPGPNFQCDECGKCFARKLSLDSHKKTHNGTKPFVCPICNKTFVHSSGLSSHLRLHRGDKPHSCEYCGKTFLQRGDKDDHVRKHTGERPFSCQHCPKSFRTRAMWFEHTRIHRDERPFPCDICGAAFRRSYALKNHKTIHTGERPHVCTICGKAFRQKQDMQKHLKNHPQHIDNQEQDQELDSMPVNETMALVMTVT
ncbi:uncharacterized protein [Periplaneta americana]|uniref:uncharacterized protein isoform X2 n=1 Tax=Periplaneta americana TaxID=6978 RepID=UPI0037E98190